MSIILGPFAMGWNDGFADANRLLVNETDEVRAAALERSENLDKTENDPFWGNGS